MSYVFDETSTDQYQEMRCPGATRVTVQVSDAPIYIGFGVGGSFRGWAAMYGDDEVLLPSAAGLDRTCDAVRIKSYLLDTPADVKMSAG